MEFDYKTFLLDLYRDSLLHWRSLLALLVLFSVLYCWYKLRRHFLLIKTAQTEIGGLYVTQKSLVKSIANICLHLGLTRLPKVKLLIKRNFLYIKIFIKLEPEQVFEKLSLSLQENIQKTLVQCLGLEKELRVDVVLTGMCTKRPATPQSNSSPEDSTVG